MSGYKRVNFYELCRLCATNQQKEKTHIFQEEGRKIQLQNKIQSCLSLKVCENDFLPKVVCSQCLRTLEECYTFRNECVTSETMLSSYFNNFRYTEDFKKSGKVYIKDIAPKIPQATEPPVTSNISTGPATSVLHTSNYEVTEKNHEQFFTVQMPTQSEQKTPSKTDSQKISSPTSYNLNSLNFAALKGIVPKGDTIGNIAVNANGEIINITPLLDLESILINSTQKSAKYLSNTKLVPQKRIKTEPNKNDNVILDANIIQIDLNQSSNNDLKYDKLPHIKSTNNKYTYTIKIEDGTKCSNINQAVVVNQVPNVNQTPFNQAAFVTSQPNTNLNGANTNLNSTLNIGNSLNNWNATHLTTPTTSNLSVSSSAAAPTANIVSAPASSNVNIVAASNISSIPSSSHVNIVSSNISTNPNLGQITSDVTNGAGLNFQSNTNWNVNSNSAPALNSGNLNTSGVFNSTQQNFQCIKPEAYNKKIRSSTLSNAVIVSNLPLQVKEEQNQSKVFPCDSCQKVFKRREHLYQHIKLHTGFRPFVCENCNKSFMRKEHLMRHMTSHSGLKNYTCDLCSKSFSRNDNLLKHKKTHDKQTSFTCEICQKQFVMKHYYLAHRLTHETEKCPVPLWNVLKT